jgi:predicted phosphodiesterase
MSDSALAVFGDIHSNLEALEAVLADMDALGIRHRVCLGDIVGYAANPSECLTLVRALGCPVLMGNHDAVAANDDALDDMRDIAKIGLEFTRQKLTAEQREYLGDLPLVATKNDFEFVHASLHRPGEWTYLVRQAALQEHFAAQTRRISFGGHTHVPCTWHLSSNGELSPLGSRGRIELPPDGKILINVGSVGQPRDLCPDGCYAVCDPQANWVEFRRVGYEIAKTRRKISRAKLPRFAAQRLSLGR